MINWILILIGLTVWLEGRKAIDDWLYGVDEEYRNLVTRNKEIKLNSDRSKYLQLEYIENKSLIKKYSGNFWWNLTYHLSTLLVIGKLMMDGHDMLTVMFIVSFVVLGITMMGKNRIYTFFSETYFYLFVLLYLIIYLNDPFIIMGIKLNFLMMLPIFLIYKIIYKNLKSKYKKSTL